ncbi:uncharacterized protein TNCV_1211371 [Trichonephila clavipes]|nr:uncharacterized protein TNCV_1211371 [Trichonephila clavipes]
MDSLKLVHPFTLILAGPSGSGKSQFVKKLIENKMIKPFPKNIIWCYGVYQALYEEMPNISFHEGIPSNLHQYSDALIVIDDLMGEESEPVPNEASLSENQETESLKENLKESVVKTEKEVFEDEIFRIVPARYKEKAKNIFQFLKLQESFSWNSDGEIIYKNTVIPGSKIAFLVNDFLRNRKSAPEGRYVFLRALNDVNLPKI